MNDSKNALDPNAHALNIIYVDDDADDRTFFLHALEKLGLPHKCRTVSSCDNLFDLLEADDQRYDMIFLDINMPKKNGNECLQRIKSLDQFKGIPVVIFSVSQNPTDIEESFSHGAHYHVVKPHAHINYVASLKTVFDMDWKIPQPIPDKKDFVINYSYK